MEIQNGIWKSDRNAAVNYNNKRQEAVANCIKANERGDRTAAIDFAKSAKNFANSRDKCNQTAAAKIFHYYNIKKSDAYIDLHELHVKESLKKLAEKINSRIVDCQYELNVIVGVGRRSKGEAKLKPSVIMFAEQHHIDYQSHSSNPGMIHMILPKNVLPVTTVIPEHGVHQEATKRKAITFGDYEIKEKIRKHKKIQSKQLQNGHSSTASESVRKELSTETTHLKTKKKSRRRSSRKKGAKSSEPIISADTTDDNICSCH